MVCKSSASVPSEGLIREDLDAALLRAFEAGDGAAVARLYGRAGDKCSSIDEACFFWTNAYVFALEAGIPEAAEFRAKLVAEGREA